ncbi:Prephenate dehydratase-domain-containing protein [Podospora conica]|nr:Prephenate dehydratase-domain-containing protein [Schizothecium conicum]
MKRTVAFLGPPASYSHQVCLDDPSRRRPTHTTTDTPPDVFASVQSSKTTYGVVPFENSTHGTVTFTLDGLADRTGCFADIIVCDEIYLDVHHFLLGYSLDDDYPWDTSDKPKGVPLTDISHIKRVYSHPQAFGQTAAWRAKHLPPGVETIDVSSTSRAAEMAAVDTSGDSAAVAGEMAGEAAGLDALARCIEDRDDNTTRFFVIRKREEGGSREGGEGEPYGARYKSLVSFTVPHRTPGALADVLDCFRRGGINLTSINSLPSLVEPFRYLFFVEFEGSRLDDPEGRVEGVFADVDAVAETWRWLGSWVNKRRMWAGGEVRFGPPWKEMVLMVGGGVRRAVCGERVGGVRGEFGGRGGRDLVFVDVERRYGMVRGEPVEVAGGRLWAGTGRAAVEEVRRLVFVRGGGGVQAKEGRRGLRGTDVMTAPAMPDYSFTLVPDAMLLFQFSALTYNAHAIHLDPEYAKEVEGYKERLVHGPLTLLLMLAALRGCLSLQDRTWCTYVRRIEYRNLAPLFVGEQMRVCVAETTVKREGEEGTKWLVWVEGPEGGTAVKGEAWMGTRPGIGRRS